MSEVVASQKPLSLLSNRNFMLLWIGQSLSLIGDYFFSATIALWIIYQLAPRESWLPLATGGVALAASFPSLLLSPIAGVFVDRWERRWTMIWTDLGRGILITLFLLITLVVTDRTVLLASSFLALLLVSCGAQFFLPARVAVIADLVPPEQHPQAYGSLQQARYFAQILGPSLAAPLYVALGPTWAISLNAGSFFVSFLLILLLRVPRLDKSPLSVEAGFWQEWKDGLRFFVGNRVLVTLLITGMLFMLGGMAYNVFEYLYGTENLHIPAQLLGLYVGCYGIGVVVGLPATAALTKRLGEVNVLWVCLIADGVIMLILSRMTTMLPGMICTLLSGILSSSIFVTVRPLNVRVTPRALIGRVMAFETPLITLASLTGGSLASILASTVLSGLHVHFAGLTFGRLDTIFLAVGILTIGAGIFARLTVYPAVKAYSARSATEKDMGHH